MASGKDERYSKVVCIGGGISGICIAAQLQIQLGEKDIHIYERNTALAGTWFANKYPGCACDIPGHFYSFSFHLNPTWTRAFSPAPEIRDYLETVVQKYDIHRRTTVSTDVTAATYDESRKEWVVYLRDRITDREYTHRCKILLSGVGTLSKPQTPVFPGIENFEGEAWHTAEYREDVDIKGKNVVVVGNGCTAAQLVPTILPTVGSVTQIGRSPHWYLPGLDFQYPNFAKRLFAWVPGLMRLHRIQVWHAMDSFEPIFHFDEKGRRARAKHEKLATDYVLKNAPEKYHKMLIPEFEIGCKRRVFDNLNYIPSLNAPNMHLTSSPISRINSRSIVTEDGAEYPADVIIYATGFHASHTLDALAVTGKGGRTLKEHWSPAKGYAGPEAYNTTAMHGFPNFFLIFGPNSSTGHTSVIMAVENIVNYAIAMAKPVLRGEAAEVEVKDEAEHRYVDEMQAALKDRVYVNCKTWYVEKSGWNASLYPWTQNHFWWHCTFPTWSDWDISYVKPAWARHAAKRLALYSVLLTGLGLAAYRSGLGKDPKAAAGWIVSLVGELQRRVRGLLQA